MLVFYSPCETLLCRKVIKRRSEIEKLRKVVSLDEVSSEHKLSDGACGQLNSTRRLNNHPNGNSMRQSIDISVEKSQFVLDAIL